MADGRLLISLQNCSVKFDEAHSRQRWALDNVNFNLHAGQRWLLMGANGSGKSVLLKLLRGDLWPTPTGRERRRYCLSGVAHGEPGDDKQFIAYLAPERQDKYLRYEWNLTITQLVTTGLFDEDIPLSKPSASQQARVRQSLKRLRLWSLRERRFLSLSYGQRRRALLARMLVAKPRVLLLDEVFNGVDARTRGQLRHELENTRRHPTWVLAAHSVADIPNTVTHLARLQQGRLVYAGEFDAAQAANLARDKPTRHRAALRQQKQLPRMSHVVKPFTAVAATASDASSAIIRLRDVELYRDYRLVLKRFDWTIRHGEHWFIVGANGSGKSSLLKLLYGDLHPALGGVIERAGMQPGMPIAQWKQRVGYVSPELQAEHHAAGTLEHIVASGRYPSVGLNAAITTADKRAAAPWLKFFDIHALRERHPRQVSYGQLRLALLARAMVNRPQLLLLDEPFTGLDPELHAYTIAALQRLTGSGVQLIMAVHDRTDIVPGMQAMLKIEQGRVTTMEASLATVTKSLDIAGA